MAVAEGLSRFIALFIETIFAVSVIWLLPILPVVEEINRKKGLVFRTPTHAFRSLSFVPDIYSGS